VRLAGAGTRDPALHLSPLPLLADSQGVRVALPETAVPEAVTAARAGGTPVPAPS